MKRGPVDLGAVVAECAGMLAPLAAARGVRVRVDASPAELDGDSDRLAQVVTNLLTNALTYNRPRGEVRVSTTVAGDDALLTVADTGVGIPAEDLPFVFDRFYRVDRARSRESGGSGLGLAICKSVVAAHGGSIAVESEPGRGTTFTVRLPRSDQGPHIDV
ncbi:MAG: HAMP domain-containing sensor histidine kinase [Isosphaeraceae bacterium]